MSARPPPPPARFPRRVARPAPGPRPARAPPGRRCRSHFRQHTFRRPGRRRRHANSYRAARRATLARDEPDEGRELSFELRNLNSNRRNNGGGRARSAGSRGAPRDVRLNKRTGFNFGTQIEAGARIAVRPSATALRPRAGRRGYPRIVTRCRGG
ncbi:hypothetical protein EVAR_281_1 [Eumeta japonica]|uniref:Uncharacterized protein n=1 Tax=Eumeta variegata TaxID=151549 RepID=A0A4C1SCK5_EUMVA|nr:hypothetical protein EVAR_281_1 [Eumeta japonica]